ncbi:MAG: ABC transporter permease [Nitrospinae bacterium]|nr:ABC transporter permease [Nitrospinota bacterium]
MINLRVTGRISLRALLVNKMRSFLTMLGIIIGVASVITMLAIGAGAGQKLGEQVASLGSNLLMVFSGSATSGGQRMGAGTEPTLTLGDAEAMRKELSAVAEAAPFVNGVAQAVYGNQNWSTIIQGTTPPVFEIRDWSVTAGRLFTWEDVRGAAKVCLIGTTVADNLFGAIDPVGKVINIKKVPFTVIGVLEKKGESPDGRDQDDTIYMPVTTAQKKVLGGIFADSVRLIFVKAKSFDQLGEAEEHLNALLRQRHRIGPKQEDDFSVRNITQVLQSAEQMVRIISLLLMAIASVSLLVGGIGIMNIMLVSVTERTKEIGIRMAVGARAADIRFQFLIEALLLSLLGGALGIALGIGLSRVISHFADWPAIITASSILLAFGFSSAVGLFFGFYPAYKASKLNPIDALRYE